jgi:hypothetical protein
MVAIKYSRWSWLIGGALVLGAAVLAGAAWSGRGPAGEANPLVVHEWGTFLSVQGSDGTTQGGMIESEEVLPAFVRERDLDGRNRACLFMKMETPVTYFYTAQPRKVRVKVDMPRGLLTHWFPAVSQFGPPRPAKSQVQPSAGGSFLDWADLELFPDTPEHVGKGKPVYGVRDGAPEGSTWHFARETDSALVKVVKGNATVRSGGEAEKFLFYRGLGEFDLPLSIQASGPADDVHLTLHNRGPETLTSVFAIQVENGLIRYARLPDLTGAGQLGVAVNQRFSAYLPQADGVRQLKRSLTESLTREGLYPREAEAMVNTWERSYFRTEGLRVLYVLPRRLTDETIPITIEPAPQQLERVMVGRVEVLTPVREQLLLKAVADLASKDAEVQKAARAELDRLGRLQEPALRRLAALPSTPEIKKEIEARLKALVEGPKPKIGG